MKKLAVWLMTAVMMLSCISVNGTTAKAAGAYNVNPAEYGIEYLLSNYQVYIKEDLTTTSSGHQVGALVVGGKAYLGNSFGNASIAPSYIYDLQQFGQTNSYFESLEDVPEYAACLTNKVYYTTKGEYVWLSTQPKVFTQVGKDEYIKVNTAFGAIETESANKAATATGVTVDGDYIVIDLDASNNHNYVITGTQLKAAKAIRFKGSAGSEAAFSSTESPVTVSFTGVAANDVTLDFNGEGGTSDYKIGVQFENSGNYSGLINSFKTWSDSLENGQVNPGGMTLMWNFPDATGTVTGSFLSGHLVAPKARVAAEGGNYEGGIIAKSAYLNSEGHFYPYKSIGSATTSEGTPVSITKSVEKVWDDNNNHYGLRPDSVSVQLYKDGVAYGAAKVLNEANSWKAEWTALDEDAVYSIEEEEIPGYSSKVVEDGGVFVLTNTVETKTVKVSKVWDDVYDYAGQRPDSVNVELFQGSASHKTATLDASNSWSYTWTDLPKYNKDWQTGVLTEIEYSVKETVPNGYTATYDDSNPANVIIKNTYAPEVDDTIEKTELTVKKVWSDNNNADGKRPASVEVWLTAGGVATGESVVLSETNNWTHTWDDLLKTDNNGNVIVYSATEVIVPDGYKASVEKDTTTGDVTVTNTYIPTSKTVKKIWNDSNDKEGLRPDSIQVGLYIGNTLQGEAITLDKNNNWTYTWTDLQKYEGTSEIAYSIKEIGDVTGYTCTTEVVDDTTTLINTHALTDSEVTATATFSKKAVSADGAELAGATITLTSDAYLTYVTKQSGSATIEHINGEKGIRWVSTTDSLVLTGLPEGNYKMTETNPPEGYKYATAIEFKVDSEGNVKIKNSNGTYGDATNTITMVDEAIAKISKKVTKVWEDNNDAADKRPDSIQVQLKANGTNKGTVVTLNEGNSWTHTWNDLYETDANGTAITYTVAEVSVPDGYESNATTDANGNVTITNTYEAPTPVTATATFSKTSATNTGELAGAVITLSTTDDIDLSVVTGSGTLDSKSEKSVTWTSGSSAMVLSGLPAGTYTMTEVTAPNGYKKAEAITFTIDENGDVYKAGTKVDGNKITMVDAPEEGSIAFSVTKELTGDEAPTETFTFVLADMNGDEIETGTVTGEGTYTFQAITYKGPDAIGTYTYTISEKAGTTTGMTYDTTAKTIVVSVEDGTEKLNVSVTQGSKDVTITNEYTKPTTSVTATATFSKTDAVTSAEVTGATITITSSDVADLSSVTKTNSSGGTGYSATTGSITWISGGSPVVLEGLPAGTYTMKETSAPSGYKYASDITFIITDDGKVTDTQDNVIADNKIIMVDEAIEKTTKKVTKVWDDDNDAAGKRPTSIKVQLKADGENQGAEVTLSQSNSWTHTWSDLDKTDARGSAIKYTVDEVSVPEDYSKKVTTAANGDVTITNTYPAVPPVTATATFSKTDAVTSAEVTGATITITSSDVADLSSVTKTNSSGGTGYSATTGSITWISGGSPVVLEGLPAGTYTMKETNAPGGYKYASDITFIITDDGKVTDTQDNVIADNKIIMVDKAIEKTTKKVTKVWDDDNDAAGKRPTSIKVQLKAGGENQGAEVTLSQSNSWTHTWSDLDKTDAHGSAIEYTVDEVSVPEDYSKKVTTAANGDVTITNTYEAAPKTGSIYLTGTKQLAGDTAPSEEYQFVVKEGNTEVATGKVTGAGDFTFTKIEYSSENIGTHTYKITEKKGSTDGMTYDSSTKTVVVEVSDNGTSPTLTASIVDAQSDDVTFVNTYKEKTTINKTIKKVWSDKNDKDELRPTSVEVSILADDVATGKTATLSAENNWTVVVENLPVKDGSGNTITYSIEETNVPTGYTATYSTSGDTLTVTNTHTPEEEETGATGGLKITVLDEETNDPVPDATVEIVFPDGTKEEKKTDENGEINYPQDPGVPTGTYEITVTDVPDGYTVTTGETGTATVVENEVAEHVAKIDTATGGLKITVLDEETNEPVPDATVEIVFPDGTKEIKKTDENGEINYPQDPGVPTGTYEITVTDVPDGYTVTTGETGTATVVENDVAEHVAKIATEEDSTSKPNEDTEEDTESDEEEDTDSDEDEDTDTDSDSREDEDDSDSNSAVKTGDDSPVKPVTVIMFIALALFAVLFFVRRRNAY